MIQQFIYIVYISSSVEFSTILSSLVIEYLAGFAFVSVSMMRLLCTSSSSVFDFFGRPCFFFAVETSQPTKYPLIYDSICLHYKLFIPYLHLSFQSFSCSCALRHHLLKRSFFQSSGHTSYNVSTNRKTFQQYQAVALPSAKANTNDERSENTPNDKEHTLRVVQYDALHVEQKKINHLQATLIMYK